MELVSKSVDVLRKLLKMLKGKIILGKTEGGACGER
jgi:hypothetical protein